MRITPWLLSALLALMAAPIAARQAPEMSFALTGDSIITRQLSVYAEPAFTRLIDLVRGADAAFTNIEMLFHDFEPYPMNESGGTYMRAEPALAKELAWAGFDLVSLANNHTGDYGALGMRLTKKYVAEAGIVAAGSGESLPEAREAKFLETPKGRIALISVASTFPDHSRAGRTRGDVPSRPGLARCASRPPMSSPGSASSSSGRPPGAHRHDPRRRAGDTLTFVGRRFVVGPRPAIRTEPRQEDVDEIAAVVKSAADARRSRDRHHSCPRRRPDSARAGGVPGPSPAP